MTTFTFHGRPFTHHGFKPHTTRDGRSVFLNQWSTPCTHPGCDSAREFTSPAGPNPKLDYWRTHEPKANSFTSSLCRKHSRVLPDHAAGGRASARVSDQDVAEMRALAAQGVTNEQLALWFPLTPGTIREIIAGRRRSATK